MAAKSDSPDVHATLCSLAEWTDTPVSLRDVGSQLSLPTLAHVVSGKYRGIAPAADTKHRHHHHYHSSSRRSSSVVYIQSVRTSQKVLMEVVKVQPNGRHVVSTGHNYSMPVTYGGWFEVLSEDGKAIEPVSTVGELAALWPPECVVRDPLRAIVCSGDKHDHPDHIGNTRLDQTRTVTAGEWLALRDVVEATVETEGSEGNPTQTLRRYLRCVDAVGDSIFLDMNQRAQLSPVAGPYNISGVHSVQSLLDKFRLPLIVRLVCGVIPTKLEKTFTSVFRLIGVYEDEMAFILPLQTSTDARMLSVSTREPLDFVTAANMDAVRQSPAFTTVERRCVELVRSYMSSIHVLVAAPDIDALARGKQLLKDTQTPTHDKSRTTHGDDDDIGLIYDEIDDIYRYVRQGGEPPTPRSQPTTLTSTSTSVQQQSTLQQNAAADYNWEEPIYEDIEKIRQRKRQRATTTETTTTTNTMTTTKTVEDREKQGSVDMMPIGNLRQLIKQFSMFESTSLEPTPRHSPVKLDHVDHAPPVPPKLTVDAAAVSAPQSDAEQRPEADKSVEDCVTLDVDKDVRQDAASEPISSPPVSQTGPDVSYAGCVTSVRISRETARRQQLHDTSPYFCSRVSVGAGSTVRPVVIDTHATVTRITTLSRQSARRRDFRQQTA